jgi:VanZ family protein
LLKLLRFWLPAVLWGVLMSCASTDALSSNHTSRFILPLLHSLFPHASTAMLDELHLLIRKAAHLTEYFVFSVLLFRAVRGMGTGWQVRWAFTALAIAAVYSALDEFHQSFVPSRTASPWDSLLDTAGATVAQICMWLWFRARENKRPAPR